MAIDIKINSKDVKNPFARLFISLIASVAFLLIFILFIFLLLPFLLFAVLAFALLLVVALFAVPKFLRRYQTIVLEPEEGLQTDQKHKIHD